MTKLCFSGRVIHGLQNGHQFGFPTANIVLDSTEITIENGVFAVKVRVKDQLFNGMLYVGTRPTLHLSTTSIEINIYNFNDDIYGENIEFEIIKKIREEKRFESKDALVEQMKKDRDEILQLFDQ